MSYENKFADQAGQVNAKEAGISPLMVGLAVALGAVALLISQYPQLFYLLVGGGLFGAVVWYIAENKRKEREAIARAAGYANCCGPEVIRSTHPNETVEEVMERCEAFREQLKLSGNPYADIIPVIPHPYSPMLYGPGQLTMGWNIYKRQAEEAQHNENLKWVAGPCPKHLRATFLSQVLGQMQTTDEQQ